MLSLIIHGSRVSLIVGFAAAAVAMLIGGTIGILAGYFGGKSDVALMRVTDYFLVIPDVPLMIVIAAIWGRSLTNIIIIIGVIYWTGTARIIRAQVKSVRERVYVRRAQALGASDSRIIYRHVLPQVAPLLVANTVLTVAIAIFAETALAFLGLGDPSLISWGRMIENAFVSNAISVDAWWAIAPPGIAVAVVILACTLLGTAIEDALNPRLRVGHLSVRRFRLRPLPSKDIT
jgi:peptide/nickel transport system permease protein